MLVIPTLGYFVLTGYYIAMVVFLSTLDLTTIKFIRDNDCSDGALQKSLEYFIRDISYNKTLLGINTGILGFSALASLFISWKFGPFPRLDISRLPKYKPHPPLVVQ